jgi:hypothetical protein
MCLLNKSLIFRFRRKKERDRGKQPKAEERQMGRNSREKNYRIGRKRETDGKRLNKEETRKREWADTEGRESVERQGEKYRKETRGKDRM